MISDNGKFFINWRQVRVWRRKHQHLLPYFLLGIAGGVVLAITLFNAPKVQAPDNPQITPTPTPIVQIIVPTTSPKPPQRPLTGKASYYSVDGCLGCSIDRTMANGQRLDDTRATLAYNHAPLNTWVTVTNIATGQSVRALITDRGGFERHGKIADLSVATKNAIGCGDVCNIKIEL